MIGYFSRMKAKKGFTIVELIIVIAIIGVLLAMILPNMFNSDKATKAEAYAKSYYFTVQDFMARKHISNNPNVTAEQHFPPSIGIFYFYTTVDKTGNVTESGIIDAGTSFSATSERPCSDIESGAINIPHAPYRQLIIDFGREMEKYVTSTEYAGTFYAVVNDDFVVEAAYWADGDIGQISTGNSDLSFSDDHMLASGYYCSSYPPEYAMVSGATSTRKMLTT